MALDPSLIEKYRRVKALAERGEGGERDNARARKARFEAEHPGIAAAAAAAEAREAVEAATRHAPPPPPGRHPGAPFTRPPAGPPPGPPPWSAGFHGPRPEPRAAPRGSTPPRPAPPPPPDAGPTTGSRIRDFFSSEFVKRAASVAGEVLGDLGAGMTLTELADTAEVDVVENTRTLKITLRVPIGSVRDARRLTGNTAGLAQLLAARLRDELAEALAEIDDDAD